MHAGVQFCDFLITSNAWKVSRNPDERYCGRDGGQGGEEGVDTIDEVLEIAEREKESE